MPSRQSVTLAHIIRVPQAVPGTTGVIYEDDITRSGRFVCGFIGRLREAGERCSGSIRPRGTRSGRLVVAAVASPGADALIGGEVERVAGLDGEDALS